MTDLAPEHDMALPWSACTGSGDCPNDWHVHGCYADEGKCDDPMDHHSGLVSSGRREILAQTKPVAAAVAAAEAREGKVAWELTSAQAALAASRREVENLRARIEELHGPTHWCFGGEPGPDGPHDLRDNRVYEKGETCPTLAALFPTKKENPDA